MTEREALLAEINADLPPGVDWREGARRYFAALSLTSPSARVYHRIKPFIGGPDFTPFYTELGRFLSVMQRIDLPMRSPVLDVGTGPGWTAHYLGKLGYRVLGIDIADDLLAIAEERVRREPSPPYDPAPLDVSFLHHDIEAGPPPGDERFAAAIVDSTLHHFHDPIAALEHTAAALRPDGLLVILETVAPPRGSAAWKHHQELMVTYHTLERPFTRRQMVRMLNVTGFRQHRFYAPVNGFFERSDLPLLMAASWLRTRCFNYVIASRDPAALQRLRAEPAPFRKLWDRLRGR